MQTAFLAMILPPDRQKRKKDPHKPAATDKELILDKKKRKRKRRKTPVTVPGWPTMPGALISFFVGFLIHPPNLMTGN